MNLFDLNDATPLEAALYYLGRGWSIYLPPPGKKGPEGGNRGTPVTCPGEARKRKERGRTSNKDHNPELGYDNSDNVHVTRIRVTPNRLEGFPETQKL